MQNYTLIGKTRKSYGIKGEMKLHINEEFLEDIFNKNNDECISVFNRACKINAQEFIVKFLDIITDDNRDFLCV